MFSYDDHTKVLTVTDDNGKLPPLTITPNERSGVRIRSGSGRFLEIGTDAGGWKVSAPAKVDTTARLELDEGGHVMVHLEQAQVADEIRMRGQLSWSKGGVADYGDSGELSVTMAGSLSSKHPQDVGNVEEALKLGDLSSAANAHYLIINLDSTNSVDLKPATGGTVTTRIGPGRFALGQFGPSVTAPFVQSSAGTPRIYICLVQA